MTSIAPDPSGNPNAGAQSEETDPRDKAQGAGFAETAANLLESYAKIMAQIAGSAASPQSSASTGETVSAALVQTWSVCSNSSVRYSQALSDVIARHQAALTDAASARLSGKEITEAQERAEVERFRRFLREMGEAAMREARRFDQDLNALGESVAKSTGTPMSEDDYRRYWAWKR